MIASVKVNESLLRSIVTQPWNENYVYARGFDSLALVKNIVLSKTCRVVVPPSSSTTVAITPTVTPSGNDSYRQHAIRQISFEFLLQC